jgi:phosphate-selective porin OprO/OprP
LGTIRVGHFKIPQSLEALTSSRFISFGERSLPVTAFCPEREMGVAAFNLSTDENATISYGAFFDNLDERTKQVLNDKQGFTFATRASWTPYYDEPSNGRYLVHTGASYKYTDVRGDDPRLRNRPEVALEDFYIDTGVIPTNDYNTFGLEGAAVWGPFSVQSEFFYVPVKDPRGAGTDRGFYGAYVWGSWFLTGENRVYRRSNGTFDRVVPYENFWLIRGAGMGKGAWEARLRWSYLDLSESNLASYTTTTANPGMITDLTLGLTWYLNPNLKWMTDYIHSWTVYDDPTKSGVAENNILLSSFRFDF